MSTALILDVETTDNDPKVAEVVELAWRGYVMNAPDAGVENVLRFGHDRPMKFGALAAHHILSEELYGLPTFVGIHDLPRTNYWIGHNVDFDWRCLGMPAVNRICTLAMSRALWPEVDSHSLSALTYFTQGDTPKTREKLRNAHSALADVHLCEDLLRFIVGKSGVTDLDALHAFSEECRIPKVMTFGKFKGEPVSSVDRGYASWYRKQPEPDPYLLTAFRRCGLL